MEDEDPDLQRWRPYYEHFGWGPLLSALRECHEKNIRPPIWVIEALDRSFDPLRKRRPKRGVLSPTERAVLDIRDQVWHDRVVNLRKKGIPYREVFQAVADEFADTSSGEPRENSLLNFVGSDETIRRAYQRVKRRNREIDRRLSELKKG